MISKIIEMSTIHITPTTAELLENEDGPLGVPCYQTSYGFLVCVDCEDEDKEYAPGDLLSCMNYAIDHDCRWLLFDRDAGEIKNLPTYDKEWEFV